MRYLALILLAFAGYAQAADIAVTRCWEPDGPYAEAGKCPAQISGAGATSIASTSFVLGHSTNTATTTTYYYTLANPTGAACGTLAPSRKAHIAGTGAYAFSTTTIGGTGAQTETIGTGTGADTALTAETDYCTFILQMTGYRASNRLNLAVQTAQASVPVVDMVLSGYFVGIGGCTTFGATQTVDSVSVTCNGTAHGRRFAHLGLVPTSAAAGTDIWILANTTHDVPTNGKFETKWAGTSANPVDPGVAYIGGYYLDTGDSNAPTALWEGTLAAAPAHRTSAAGTTLAAGTHTLPYIQGALTDGCLETNSCDWDYRAASFPNECQSNSDSIVTIKHAYVTVRGVAIGKSRCRNLSVDPDGDVEILGVRIRESIIEKSGYQAFVVGKFARQSVAKANIFRSAGRCVWSRDNGGTQEPVATGDGNCANAIGAGHSGGAVVSNDQNAFFGYSDNTFIRSHSEGIQCLNGSHVWFKGNRVGNTSFSPNYLDACEDAIVESNVFWSTQGDVGQQDGRSYSSNTAAARTIVEAAQAPFNPASKGNTIRNNLFSYMGQGYVLAKQPGTTVSDVVGVSLYHNTIIGARQRLVYLYSSRFSGPDVEKIDFRNNILQGPNGTQDIRCYADAQATYDYNLWGIADSRRFIPPTPANPGGSYDTTCQGANDVGGDGSAGNPGLTLNAASSWEALDWENMPDPDDARLVADTNVGTDLNDAVACTSDIVAADLANWATIALEMDYPYSLDANSDGTVTTAELANWSQCAYYDFFGNARSNTPNMGMHEHGGGL